MRLTKGHGTENDFLVLDDRDGAIELTPASVRALCDRRGGLGADGILRVVRSENDPEAAQFAGEADYFMDYRNADGSIAEMCGNGVRVFHRYLLRHSLVEEAAAVATRGGIRRVRARGDGNVTVSMGLPRILADRPIATAAPDFSAAGTALTIPNPHVVVPVADVETLIALDLASPPDVQPALPGGQNVEFVVRLGPRHLRMRVHERGSGETRSCGTGICAAAVATALSDGTGADGSVWRVDVPGGSCEVVWTEGGAEGDGEGDGGGDVELTGPAVLVAEIDLDDEWLRATMDPR